MTDLRTAAQQVARRVIQRLKAVAFLPLLPVAVLIDMVVGDAVTRVKTPVLKKVREHCSAWLDMWNRTAT